MSTNVNNTTANVFRPEKWSTDVTRDVEASLVLWPLTHSYSSMVKDNGKSVHIPTITNLVANDKVQNTSVSFQAPTETDVELLLDQHKEASFVLENITEIQANVDLSSEYTSKAAYALAQARDTFVAGFASTFSQTKGTYNTAITTDVILDSIQLLDDANVPQDDRHFVMKPKTKRDIIDITTYISNDFVGGRPVENGKLGSVYGVNTYMTTQIVQTGTSTNNMMFHRDAIGTAMQKEITTNSDYSVSKIGTEVVTDEVYGGIEVRDTFGVLIKS